MLLSGSFAKVVPLRGGGSFDRDEQRPLIRNILKDEHSMPKIYVTTSALANNI